MLAVGERAMIAKRAGHTFLFEIVKFHEWKDIPDLDKINWHTAKGAMMARVRWFAVVGDDDGVVPRARAVPDSTNRLPASRWSSHQSPCWVPTYRRSSVAASE